ncbi:hypothetical protein AB0C93_04665 [Streptomyces sp. NPDC048518]|uniref:hypothetical protein n=1 Tax=Streptomyces sp. NPDC048518 TaxID=3155029 RepID=UPI0033CB48FD
MSRKAGVIMALACVVGPLTAATPAAASESGRSCYSISKPYKGINEIFGKAGKKANCLAGEISLQRHRAWGWQVVGSVRLTGSTSKLVMFKCAGQGTFNYKTSVTLDYQIATYESKEIRLSC